MAHTYYRQPGGEDEVFRTEALLLESRGHRVIRYSRHNRDIEEQHRIPLAAATIWNTTVYRELRALLRLESPDLIHFHNTFPTMSPSVYYAARAAGVPVIQTLHNYRLLCTNGMLLRDSRPCELCVGKTIALPAVLHSCYRHDRGATTVTAAMLAWHRILGTWAKAVDIYIALTHFARRKYISGGIPAEHIMVKPNFLDMDPGTGQHAGGFGCFVGRLAPEKGLATLRRAWSQLRRPFPLKIAGDGPLHEHLDVSLPHIEWLGYIPKNQVFALMKDATFLIAPSEWYEAFPLTVLEAFATGLPVIGPSHGFFPEVVVDGVTGRLFRPNDPIDLALIVDWAVDHQEDMAVMGSHARAEFDAKYTADRNYSLLMDVYASALLRPRG